MALVYKINTATIRKNGITRNKSGFLLVPITFMKIGVLLYRDWDTGNIIREYVSLEELKKSLISANGTVYTNEHPQDMVYPDNWSKYTLGCIHSVTLRDDTFLDAIATIYDPDEIRAIETTDKEEISAGYWCDTFDTPNAISPDNESYDKEQKDIEYNHISRVWFGRAGEDVKIKKNIRKNNADIPIYYQIQDENNNLNNFKKNERLVTMIINGRDVKMNEADEVFMTQFLKDKEAAEKKNEADLKEIQKKNTEAQAELDITKKKLNDLESKDWKREVKNREDLESFVKPVLGNDFKFEGLSDTQVKRNYLEVLDSEIKGKDDTYINTYFDFYKKNQEKLNSQDNEKYNQADDNFEEARKISAGAQRNNSKTSTDLILDKVFEKL